MAFRKCRRDAPTIFLVGECHFQPKEFGYKAVKETLSFTHNKWLRTDWSCKFYSPSCGMIPLPQAQQGSDLFIEECSVWRGPPCRCNKSCKQVPHGAAE